MIKGRKGRWALSSTYCNTDSQVNPVSEWDVIVPYYGARNQGAMRLMVYSLTFEPACRNRTFKPSSISKDLALANNIRTLPYEKPYCQLSGGESGTGQVHENQVTSEKKRKWIPTEYLINWFSVYFVQFLWGYKLTSH